MSNDPAGPGQAIIRRCLWITLATRLHHVPFVVAQQGRKKRTRVHATTQYCCISRSVSLYRHKIYVLGLILGRTYFLS